MGGFALNLSIFGTIHWSHKRSHKRMMVTYNSFGFFGDMFIGTVWEIERLRHE